MTRKTEHDQIREALAYARDRWDGTPKIHQLDFEIGEDQAGDPAVFVIALLDDSTSDADWVSEKLDPIRDHVRNAVAKLDSDRIVYVRYARPKDLKEAADDVSC